MKGDPCYLLAVVRSNRPDVTKVSVRLTVHQSNIETAHAVARWLTEFESGDVVLWTLPTCAQCKDQGRHRVAGELVPLHGRNGRGS